MKLILAVAALLISGGVAATVHAREPRQFTILHTNDMHGRHAPFHVAPGDATAQTGDPGRDPTQFDRAGMVGGFAYLAGAVRDIRARDGASNVLLLDGGDTFGDDLVGNETKGAAMIGLMNALGYQFMALGNHDFDYGLERTRALQAIAKFPMRGANALENGKPVFGEPYKFFTIGGVKVAVLALSYHNTDQTGSKANVKGVDFVKGTDVARRYVPMLRAKADVVIVLSHQGTLVDRALARAVGGIDLIVGAHSHDRISPPERVNGVWIAQALSDDAALGELTVTLNTRRKVTSVRGKVVDLWNDRFRPDPAIARLVEQTDAPYRAQMDAVLATAFDRIGRQYKSESPFDSLVGQYMRAATGADIAFMPGVGYGVSIEPGPITRDRLYTLLPHPTKMVTLEMTGAQIETVLEQSATNLNPVDVFDRVGGLVQTSGMDWTLDLNLPVGRRLSAVTVAGKAIDSTRWYKVATNAGMTGGLHRYVFEGRNAKTLDISITKVVEDAMVRDHVIVSPSLGHIRLVRPVKS
jgi:5'-nucleotidase/UDP-sugar diphosphatase